jgi:hypothetical protein
MTPEQRARQGFLINSGCFVAKNSWWMALCPKHGQTQHLGYLGGACVECQKERVQPK